jgi:hypothetical protein
MQLVLFKPRNEAPDCLKIRTLAAVLNAAQTDLLNSWGGVVNFLSHCYPKSYSKYESFELSIGEQAVLVFHGWGEDNGCGYLRMKLEEMFGKEEFVIGTYLPTHAQMMVSRVPRARHRLTVFIDQGLPPQNQQKGKLLTAYRRPIISQKEDIKELISHQGRIEFESEEVFLFKASKKNIGKVQVHLMYLDRMECQIGYHELTPFNYLLARKAYTDTGHRLTKKD